MRRSVHDGPVPDDARRRERTAFLMFLAHLAVAVAAPTAFAAFLLLIHFRSLP